MSTLLRDLLTSYCEAFGRREVPALLTLFADHALFEMPLLGQRLVGKGEVAAGLECIFGVTEYASIALAGIQASPRVVLGEGRLIAKLHRDSALVSMKLGVALEAAAAGGISRLSMYLDAHPNRLWTDGMIFAAPPPADSSDVLR